MGSLRRSRCCIAALLVTLLVCQAIVLPTVAGRTLVEEKHVVAAQTTGSQKSVSTQDWSGRGRGGGGGGGGGQAPTQAPIVAEEGWGLRPGRGQEPIGD